MVLQDCFCTVCFIPYILIRYIIWKAENLTRSKMLLCFYSFKTLYFYVMPVCNKACTKTTGQRKHMLLLDFEGWNGLAFKGIIRLTSTLQSAQKQLLTLINDFNNEIDANVF
ncbi:MAG: hypothetical protein ACK5M1_08525 [Xanthomarina gelatinilytica]|uniref:hypothetical protein n=1 Tax=Xanthomarina gelatinilytica TaxID=1137281 RepID=UPI003A8A3146